MFAIKENSYTIAIAFLTTILFIGGAFPYGFPLFSPCVIGLFLLFFIDKKPILLDRNLPFFLFLIFIYILPIVFFGKMFAENISDIVNSLSVLGLFIIFQSTIQSRTQFNQYFEYFQKLIFISSFLISAVGILKFIFLLQGFEISYFRGHGQEYPWGTTLVDDYNMFGLCLVIGLVSGFYIMKRKLSFLHYTTFSLMAMTILVAIIFSASRRAWFILAVIIFGLASSLLKDLIIYIFRFISTFRLRKLTVLKTIVIGVSIIAVVSFLKAWLPTEVVVKHKYQLDLIQYRFVSAKNLSQINMQYGSRYNRYKFAFQILNEYSIINCIFGNGTNYLQSFGHKFNGTGNDYPHAPLLSAILQSGLIGGIYILGYVCYGLFLYLKLFQYPETRFCFIVMLISSFYFLISGNSIFSSKIFIFFNLLMPFAINNIFKYHHYSDGLC